MGFFGELIGGITGSSGAEAAQQSAAELQNFGQAAIRQQNAGDRRAQGFFSPFQPLIGQGIESAQFLADPQAQFDFLQNNPLFNLGLDNLNQQTQASAAAGGRLSAGDTSQQLINNALLAAQPLLQGQRQDINQLLNVGQNIAGNRANIALNTRDNISGLLTDIGSARAGGVVGAQNAQQGGLAQQLGGSIGGGVSSLITGGLFG